MTESYQIYALKYRPKTFEEMVGQKAVVRTLQNAIKANRVGQAYLFAGMRGVGKTTAARILAKALNCVNGPTPTPCNVCESCKSIREDHSIDVLEIDGASNRGIEDVKTLRESVKYKPIQSRYKVVIIDEVHMLSREAFNALLKTLEEPPPGTVFIFATTELHKVPATILSRCQVFEFKKASPRDIVNHLNDIATQEKLKISPGGLALIAEASEGSLRDSLSLLDQAVAFCGEIIEDVELKEILGAVNRDLLFEFSTAVLEEKPDRIFALTAKVLEAGHDLRIFMKELIQHFRNILVVKSVKQPEDLIALLSPEELARLRVEADKGGEDDFLRYLQALQNAEPGLRFSSHPQIHFETTLVKLCHYRKLVSLKDILQNLEEPKKGGPGAGPADSRPSKPAWTTPAAPRKSDTPASLRDSFRPKPPVPNGEDARPSPAGRSPLPPPAADVPPSARKKFEETALKDPGVRSFMDKFKARVITIDELKGKPETEEN